MKSRGKQSIFFAIPCGEFYSIQNKCIKGICNKAGVKPIIIEDHSQTASLCQKIINAIESSDYFISDVSSLSPNIVFELGFALRAKDLKKIAIFISENIGVPVDLQGFVLQKYCSIRDFQEKLAKWIVDNIEGVDRVILSKLNMQNLDFFDDFKNRDKFENIWRYPTTCSLNLSAEGLHFTGAHMPIMTTKLSLLTNYEFEFRAKIIKRNMGWIIKGTWPRRAISPIFCIMFNINPQGGLCPHILNINKIDPVHTYNVFIPIQTDIAFSEEGWFTFVTRVEGDRIMISNGGNIIFNQNFGEYPYKEFYDFPNKTGEVGFRCDPWEEGIINYVKVKEL